MVTKTPATCSKVNSLNKAANRLRHISKVDYLSEEEMLYEVNKTFSELQKKFGNNNPKPQEIQPNKEIVKARKFINALLITLSTLFSTKKVIRLLLRLINDELSARNTNGDEMKSNEDDCANMNPDADKGGIN